MSFKQRKKKPREMAFIVNREFESIASSASHIQFFGKLSETVGGGSLGKYSSDKGMDLIRRQPLGSHPSIFLMKSLKGIPRT